MLRAFLIVINFIALSSVMAIEPPTTIYRVEVGDQDLISLESELEAQGWGPLALDQQPWGFRLLLGEAEYHIDALLCANYIQDTYGLPTKVVAIENSEGKATLGGIQGPMRKVFKVSESHMSELPDLALPEGDPLVEEIQTLQGGTDKLAYRRALMKAINDLPNSDVRKGFATTRKGILELLDGSYDEALYWLQQVANGEVTARRLDRNKCMRRVAWIFHQQKNRFQAYKAYRDLESFSENELVLAMVRVECAGLLMELARYKNPIGSLAECRLECKKILEMTDEEYQQQRATAELMFLETFVHEGKHEIAATLADEFVAKYPDRPRELSMALLFQAYAHNAIGNYVDAKEALLRVLNTPWPQSSEESWQAPKGGRWDLKDTAAAYLKDFAGHVKDEEGIAIAESYISQ